MSNASAFLARSGRTLAPLAGLIVVLVAAVITTPGSFTVDVLRLVLFQIGLIGVTAIGQTLVLLVGGIDLSIGAVMTLATVIVATTTNGDDSALLVAVVLAVLAGLAVGAANSALVQLRSVPPFVATFATFVLVQGIIVAWTRGAPSGAIPDAMRWLGIGRLFDFIPVPAVVFAVLAVVVGLVLVRTTLGRRVYATGANPRAARLSGVPTGWIVTGAYLASALTAVLAGLINAGYIGYVDAGLSRSLDLNSIAAAVIGGVALTGGKGRIGQTVVGVVLLAVLLTWLVQLGAGAGAQLIVSGIVILGAVWLQSGRFTLSTIRHLTRRTTTAERG
ncbi:ABC transporter permease [Cnuibacter physcomitrellae]|uniref:ABC transporter permease n=1 Tax=Cnuibacter physcomitrellae TaxID=1619308 RepID=UPI002175A91D|nr:ABC transporter permease [Cnuibacter physcomitrellae]MCS5497601.1 ABC transporter permease [Cnuibacter physcomitrellae]